MSTPARVLCVTCRIAGPELGDGGYIGHPSLSENPARRRRLRSFGWLFRGFEAIGFLPIVLLEMRSFLVQHDGHRVVLQDEFGPSGEATAEAEITLTDEKIVDGQFSLRCSCGAVISASRPAQYRALEPFTLDARRRSLYAAVASAAGTGHVDGGGDPLLDRDPDRFATFLLEHDEHDVTASVEAETDWVSPSSPATRPRAAGVLIRGFEPPTREEARLTLSAPLRLVWARTGLGIWPHPVGRVVITRTMTESIGLDVSDGTERWRLPGFALTGPQQGDCVLSFQSVEDRGTWWTEVRWVDLETGDVVEQHSSKHAPDVVLDGGRAFLGRRETRTGHALALIKLTPAPSVVWEIEEPNASHAMRFGPVCAGGERVFVARGRILSALRLADGQTLWEADVESPSGPTGISDRAPSLSGGTVITHAKEAGTLALDAATGRRLWFFENGRGGQCVDGRVWFWTERDGRADDVVCSVVEAGTGELLARWDMQRDAAPSGRPAALSEAPIVAASQVLVADVSGRLWALDPSSGNAIWRHRPPHMGDGAARGLAVADRHLVFHRLGSNERQHGVYCYEQV